MDIYLLALLLDELRQRLAAQAGAFAEALPYIAEGVADLEALARLASGC